jgi:hypothetical protein
VSIIIDLPLQTITAADLDGDTYHIPAGKYHVLVTAVEKSKPDDPKEFLRVRYEVLAGTASGHQGTRMSEKFFLSQAAIKRLAVLASRLGLLDKADFGQPKPIDWSGIVGRDLVVELADNKYVNKNGQEETSSQWAYAGFWAADDVRASAVPKDFAAKDRRVRELLDMEAANLDLGAAAPSPASAVPEGVF